MIKASAEKIEEWLRGMDRFNSTVGEGTTRILFTEPELQNREYVKEEMRKLGLTVTEDAIGNIFGTLEGTEPTLAPVWTGSHIDTVPNAGMFDGMAGVVSGMEAIRMIKESGKKNKRSISVIAYTSEEPTRFGLSCLGSRAMAGVMSLEETKEITDSEGKSLYQVLGELGYNYDDYDKIRKKHGDVYAAVELHIEQNSVLEKAELPVGIVRGICAPTNFKVTIKGVQSHAGGTSMADRKDAFMAACELALCFEKMVKESNGEYVTGTVGYVDVYPNAVNVISGLVRMTIDIRSIEMAPKEAIVEQLKYEVARIMEERGVEIEMLLENHDIPLVCDSKIMNILQNICTEKEIPSKVMISGPYHDSLFVGRFAPTAMLFVPSKNGISHSKDEWTDFEDIATGTDVLAEALIRLANE